jgi:hypothetical protein
MIGPSPSPTILSTVANVDLISHLPSRRSISLGGEHLDRGGCHANQGVTSRMQGLVEKRALADIVSRGERDQEMVW